MNRDLLILRRLTIGVAMVLVGLFGWFYATFYLLDASGAVYSTRLHGYEIRIFREDKFPDPDPLMFEVWQDGKCYVGPGFLGTYSDSDSFDSLFLPDHGILAVYEAKKPNVLLIICDTNNGEVRPKDYSEEDRNSRDRLLAKINKATGKKYVFCDLNSSRGLDFD